MTPRAELLLARAERERLEQRLRRLKCQDNGRNRQTNASRRAAVRLALDAVDLELDSAIAALVED